MSANVSYRIITCMKHVPESPEYGIIKRKPTTPDTVSVGQTVKTTNASLLHYEYAASINKSKKMIHRV